MSASEIVVLGRLTDPYGVRGWIRLHAFGDDPLTWAEMPTWWIGAEGGSWREVKPRGLKTHGDGLVTLLEGVSDRSAAEALKGWMVGAPRECLPATGEGEFYWADLIGMVVINVHGERLGKVVGLIETGASDVLRVLADGNVERLLPFVDAVVLSVEKEACRIRVDWALDW